jgi:exodeoxyribonuclease VII small subunit
MASEKFETVLKKLEDVVKKLESGELSLDESLKAFEEGVKYASFCSKKLEEAESRVEVLLRRKDGSFEKRAFLTGEDDRMAGDE